MRDPQKTSKTPKITPTTPQGGTPPKITSFGVPLPKLPQFGIPLLSLIWGFPFLGPPPQFPPFRADEDFEYGFEDEPTPSPQGYGGTPNPQTPGYPDPASPQVSQPYNPQTPGTPAM